LKHVHSEQRNKNKNKNMLEQKGIEFHEGLASGLVKFFSSNSLFSNPIPSKTTKDF
jgi:hypothetical protein